MKLPELMRFIGLTPTLLTVATALPAATTGGVYSRSIETELQRGGLRGASVAILVVDAATGATVYERRADDPLVPASVTKIATSAAALKLLSPQFKFETALIGVGTQRGATFDGDIFVRASGDPDLVEERVWGLVKELRDNGGIEVITGRLRIDDSYFDAEHFGADWGPRSRAWYHAPHGAVSVNYNTIPRGSRFVAIEGDPSDYAARFFLAMMRREGIEVRNGIGPTGVVPADGKTLATSPSKTLSAIVADLNKVSNNFIAEQLLKTLGATQFEAPGTVDKGLDVVTGFVRSLGVPEAAFQLADGSGLSRSNRMSPRTIVTILRAMAADFEVGPEFTSSLKVAGAEGSAGRFSDPRCYRRMRVKTGHLYGVAALAGFGETEDGRQLVFAILANDYRRGRVAADASIERVCEVFLATTGEPRVASGPKVRGIAPTAVMVPPLVSPDDALDDPTDSAGD